MPKQPPQMFSWMNPKLEVRMTDRYGKGVFAKEAIKKDEMLFVMGGYGVGTRGRIRRQCDKV